MTLNRKFRQNLRSIKEGKGFFLVENSNFQINFLTQEAKVIPEKSIRATKLSKTFHLFLQEMGIPTHFIEMVSDNQQKCHFTNSTNLYVSFDNFPTREISKKFKLNSNMRLKRPNYSIYFFEEGEGDLPLKISKNDILNSLQITDFDFEDIFDVAQKINDYIYIFLRAFGLQLRRIHLGFGIKEDQETFLAPQLMLTSELCLDMMEVNEKTYSQNAPTSFEGRDYYYYDIILSKIKTYPD